MRNLSIAFACLILFTLLTIFASYTNMKHYYVTEKDGAVEIWQGRFAPKGKKRLMTFPGVDSPAKLKPVYSWNDICPLAFRYYLNKADTISEVPGVPDFDGIQYYLSKALAFATTEEQRKMVISRRFAIDIMILVYKADISMSKGTLKDLTSALSYLQQAKALDLNGHHTDAINQRIDSLQLKMKQIPAQ